MNPFRFKLSLRIWHPTLSGDEVCKIVDLAPTVSQTAGKRRTTPKGRQLEGLNRSTFCMFAVASGSDKQLMRGIHQANAHLLSRKRQLRRLITGGGDIEYYLALFLSANSGFVIEPKLLKECAGLNVRIALDVYPADTESRSHIGRRGQSRVVQKQ